jgi:poly-gamma-glutamate synthesis protein (capsule biosynthesis protein)
MKGFTVTNIFLFLIPIQLTCQEIKTTGQKISLLFIGDIMGHDEQLISAKSSQSNDYNFEDVFSLISPIITEADFAIANLEVTLAGPPYKGYPQFSSPVTLALACKNAGINYLVTANNHSADRGKQGLSGTIHRLDSLSIFHTGTFNGKDEKESLEPLILSKNGISAALLNYTYGTNGVRVPPPLIVNYIDSTAIVNDIIKARKKNPDIIILFLHWGKEYETIPSADQERLAGYLLENGADIIIGSHPHVVQKMIWNKKSGYERDNAVIYSLGNFVSNQTRPGTDGGSMVRIELEKNEQSVNIAHIGYYLTWVCITTENNRKKYSIIPCSEYENNPEFFPNQVNYEKMKKFMDGSRELLKMQNLNVREIVFIGKRWLSDI